MDASDSKPLITTVIPTYRRPAMLRRAIRSVLNQTFPDFRVCVYDNASGDETGAVVEEFRRKDSRVEYICRPSNVGAYQNFVDGASHVETPYISFLPDDDLLLPHFFEAALNGFREHPEAAFSTLATLHVTQGGFVRDAWILDWPRDGLLVPGEGTVYALRHGNPGLPAMLIHRDVWEEFGGFDKAVAPNEDFDFELRVAAVHPIVVCRQPGAIQVVHSGSSTSAVDLHWVWPAAPRIIKKFQDLPMSQVAKNEVIELLTRQLKRGLTVRGALVGFKNGNWADMERATDLLEDECGLAKRAAILRGVGAICRRLPGTRALLRGLFELRAGQKIIRNLGVWWRFRGYMELLRVSTAEASSTTLGSYPRSASEDDGSLLHSRSARKTVS